MELDFNLIHITDPGDSRLGPFLHLPLRKAAGRLSEGLFIAEGRMVVERLLRSPYQPAGLVITNNKLEWCQAVVRAATNVRPDLQSLPIYVLPDDVLNQVVGFEFHSGIMGSGLRTVPPALQQLMTDWFAPRLHNAATSETLVVLPAMNSAENLGSIIRSAQGLGAAGLVLSSQSADHLSRRVIRVSMGHALAFPCWRSEDWIDDLRRLRAVGFRLIGIEHHARMQPLATAKRSTRQALIFGNEFAGLDDATLEMMDDVVGIEMQNEVDSLNVAVTAAIALHHFVPS
ncbi:MAG: RNA methyltransferase [Pirellulaceae bacterium]|nr:RNA methyltransferase [Pirellulaceae bacterium]